MPFIPRQHAKGIRLGNAGQYAKVGSSFTCMSPQQTQSELMTSIFIQNMKYGLEHCF